MKKIMFNDKYGLTQAVLEGRKTMTRRMVPGKLVKAIEGGVPGYAVMESKYKVGEVVAVAQSYEEICLLFIQPPDKQWGVTREMSGYHNKMFVRADIMPHRIRITNVRVERLQDISDEDCLKEGIEKDGEVYSFNDYEGYKTPRNAFAELIDRVSGKGTWLYNPLVFVYEFELVK